MQQTIMERNAKRGQIIRFLRKFHGWLGLWGAVLGLVFGLSGFLLNHRVVMKIQAAKMEEIEIQLPMQQPLPENAKTFAVYIQKALGLGHEAVQRPPKKGSKPETDVAFLGKELKQPAIWKAEFQLPQAAIHAEYVFGNQYATIKREDANFFAFIMRMHKGVGMNAGWILLADTLAGAMIMLSITGVLLWTKMRGSRLILTGLTGGSLVLTILLTWQSL